MCNPHETRKSKGERGVERKNSNNKKPHDNDNAPGTCKRTTIFRANFQDEVLEGAKVGSCFRFQRQVSLQVGFHRYHSVGKR